MVIELKITTMKHDIMVEIRDAEGGSDSKLLVKDMGDIYIRAAKSKEFNWALIEQRDGYIQLGISGKGAKELFNNEVGSHRWIRIPPTEKKGRTQTSTITVAVMEQSTYKEVTVPHWELKIETARGTGNGGQHKNSTDSCVTMTHIPTGIKVVRDGRSQHENRALALEEITKRVNHFYRTGHLQEESTVRKSQIGEGARSDKRRTYRVKDGIVIDHITNRTVGIRDVLRGRIDLFINEGVV